jgi:hypothetical protein
VTGRGREGEVLFGILSGCGTGTVAIIGIMAFDWAEMRGERRKETANMRRGWWGCISSCRLGT